MSPVTHFLASWMVANLAQRRRDRALITFAGVAPDLDGLGIVPELLTRNTSHPLPWFTEYQHVLGHNLGFALVVAIIFCSSAEGAGLLPDWHSSVFICICFAICGRARAGWLPVANQLSRAFLQFMAVAMERAMGIKRLAQFYDHISIVVPDLLAGSTPRLFSFGNVLWKR